jgi:diguanylate cyclase (GGDEF)-like protein
MGRKPFVAGCILPFLIFSIVPSLPGQHFEAEVIEVKQGDLLTVRHHGKAVEVALHGVECPRPREPFGKEARQFTSRMVLDRKIQIQVQQQEDKGRITGSVVLPDGILLNHKLVQHGLASWDRESAPNDIKLQTLEDSARELSLGLWSSPTPTAGPTPATERPTPAASRPSKAFRWTRIFSTMLALLVAAVVAIFFLLKARKPRDEGPRAPPPARKEAPAEDRQSDEQGEAIESGRNAIQDLLRSLSEFVSDLMNRSVSYDSKMKDHKVSIDQAMTMAGLEEIKRLLVHEIEEMQATSEDYRRQLEHANATIQDQQKIMERFRIDAKMDFLTRIPNRRAFETRLKEEFERAKRYRSIFSLIMIDIDHFKKVNDLYGHMAGDQILRLVAQVLEDQTRFNDFVSRYGGEEFAVLLPESSADQGRYVADKIRQTVENTSLVYADIKIKVTVSAGVGEVIRERDTQETFVERVDAALYQAKQNGRNRVEMSSD